MQWKRRTFLKTLLAGIASTGALSAGIDRYGRALAAPSPRKLALLVGIDDYGSQGQLPGCGTDVELQRELLVCRFGFSPRDIITLKGRQATREAIETAFLEHLAGQVEAGDVAVFHFSGYGTQVELLGIGDTDKPELIDGFLPSDGILPTQETAARNDLLEATLLLLARSLPTDKLTLVLDTSHQPAGKLRGNLRVRSFPSPAARPNLEELAFQGQLQQRLKATSKRSPLTATILRAAAAGRVAAEIGGEDFHAGLFTYLLTQYLWQATPPSQIVVALSRVAEQIAPLMGEGQQPQWDGGGKPSLFAYALMPEAAPGAEGAITGISGQEVEIHLWGLPLNLLPVYGLNSCLEVTGTPSQLQIYSRQGLVAKAKLLSQSETRKRQEDSPSKIQNPKSKIELQVGQAVQETIRILPRHLGLLVALAPELERIERVDATSALAAVPAVTAVAAAGEQAADCVLGKLPEGGNYGLFSPGGNLLPNTAGAASEAIKSAVGRLAPHLEQLLALKCWQLTANEGSSRFAARALLKLAGAEAKPLLRRETRRQIGGQGEAADSSPEIPAIPSGSLIQYQLDNRSNRPAYCLLVGVDASGKAVGCYCPQPLPAGASLTVPTAGNWSEASQSGLAQVQVIFATAPFTGVAEVLKQANQFDPERQQLLALSQLLNFATALLQDLHAASGVPSDLLAGATDVFALDVRAWASFRFLYRVTEPVGTI
jgi:hypothetical protein